MRSPTCCLATTTREEIGGYLAEITAPVASHDGLRPAPRAPVSVDITNSGSRAGDEVAQLYVKHSDAKVARQNEELTGSQRVNLQPGETTTVQLPLAAESLAYLDEEPVALRLGSSSADIRLEQKIAVVCAK
jgi:beta-glucosidase